MSAALLKINKSVCHLCAALDRHATVHLGPFAEKIGSWILKSRLASGKLGDKQTNQTAKQKRKGGGAGVEIIKLWFVPSLVFTNEDLFLWKTALADGRAACLDSFPRKFCYQRTSRNKCRQCGRCEEEEKEKKEGGGLLINK